MSTPEILPMPKTDVERLQREAGGMSATVVSALIHLEVFMSGNRVNNAEAAREIIQETIDILKTGRDKYDSLPRTT